MAAPPTWTRRVPGIALLLFFVSLIAFTYLAVHFWNTYQMELTALFTALASAAPLLIVYVFYVARPVWALQAPLDERVVERAILGATAGMGVQAVHERKGVLKMCSGVVDVAEPRCTVGWFRGPAGAAEPRPSPSTVLLLPRSWDRKSLAAFRDAVSGALLRAEVPA